MRRILPLLLAIFVLFATSAFAKQRQLLKDGEPFYKFEPRSVLVKFDAGVTGSQIDELARQAGGKVAHWSELLDYYRIEFAEGTDLSEAVVFFRSQKDVEWANFNYIAEAFFTPNDQYYSYQWHYPRINLPQAWDITRGSSNVIVADADQGWQFDHEDFAGVQVVSPRDEVDGDNDPEVPGLVDSHGMHTAGTILAATNNNTGVAGVAPNCRLMPIRVLGDEGSGNTEWIANGIAWAGAHGAHVLNLSLGYAIQNNQPPEDPGPPLSTAVAQCAAAGTIMCVSSGNDGADYVSYPAAYDQTIAVGSTAYDDAIAPYSNRGTALDVTAPGGNTDQDLNQDGYIDGVLSTLRNAEGDYYAFWQGTSMAAPHVSGVAALLISNGLAANQVRQALQSTAVDLGSNGRDNTFGYGRIDALAALNYQGGGGGETTLLAEPFDGQLQGDWIVQERDGNGIGWQWLADASPDCDDQPHGGSNAAWHDDENGVGHQDDWLITPTVSIPAGATDVQVVFWQRNCYVGPEYYEYHGFLYSTDGTNWIEIAELDQDREDWTEYTVDANALAGQNVRFAWRYTGTYATEWFLDDLAITANVSGAAGDASTAVIPIGYTLGDPYPNPFNNSARIPFELKTSARVDLAVYNVLGQQVATLVAGDMLYAGSHNIEWNATAAPSGVYLIRMNASGITQTRKIVLMK